MLEYGDKKGNKTKQNERKTNLTYTRELMKSQNPRSIKKKEKRKTS